MVNASREYNMYERAYQQTQLKFISENIDHYPIFEQMLGFQWNAVHLIDLKISKDRSQLFSDLHKMPNEIIAELINLDLCRHNNGSLYSALRPIEQGITAVHNNIIRTVFESVPKIFYLLRHPEDSCMIMLKEEYRIWHLNYVFSARADDKKIPRSDELVKEFIESEHGRKIVDISRIAFNKKFCDDFRKKHTNPWFRNQIYVGNQLEIQNSIHSFLSTSAHANTNRSRLVKKSEPGTNVNPMRLFTELSFFNLYLIVASQKRMLSKIGKYDECVDFVQKKDQELGSRFAVTSLYPSYTEYQVKL